MPMHLAIDVVYDTETNILEVIADPSLEAEVYLYNAYGMNEDYSETINAQFIITVPGIHEIQIQGDGWYAVGQIEI